MSGQSRSAATRQAILDAAVELFCDRGYSETGISDIIAHAEVSTGAFYYHFASKEALAFAVADQGWPKALAVVDRCLSAPAPGLENVIVMNFALSALMKSDRSVWIANHLNGAFGQLSDSGRLMFKDHAETFIGRLADVMAGTDFRAGVTAEQVGTLVWINLHGCHLLSDAMMDSVSERLVLTWSTMLRGIVPDDSLGYFEQFVKRTAAQYAGTRAGK